MNKIGVADYGMNVWDGALYDYNERLTAVRSVGYDGIERLEAGDAARAVQIMTTAKQLKMNFSTCRGANASESIQWSAAFGLNYVWCESKSNQFDEFCRQANRQIQVAEVYGIKVGLHNHLGTAVETEQQLLDYIKACPESGIILDVGHLAAAGGNPVDIINKFSEKLVAVHLKDYQYKDKSAKYWWDQLRFCELGAGVMGDLNRDIIKSLIKNGYDGWIFVEHDTHLQNPLIDLKISRKYIKSCGL